MSRKGNCYGVLPYLDDEEFIEYRRQDFAITKMMRGIKPKNKKHKGISAKFREQMAHWGDIRDDEHIKDFL